MASLAHHLRRAVFVHCPITCMPRTRCDGRRDDGWVNKKRTTRSGKLGLATAAGLLGAAIAKERRLPSSERRWVGKIAGVVPYDLRRPTAARIRHALWAPDDPHVVVPHPFGVGWTLNIGRLVRLVRGVRNT